MEKEKYIQKMIKEYGFTTEQAEKMYKALKIAVGSKNDYKTIEERGRESLKELENSLQFTLDRKSVV